MSKIGIKFMEGGRVFNFETSLEVCVGDRLVVESVRGLELAYACDPVTKEENQEEIKEVLRVATQSDLDTAEEQDKQSPKIIKITNELITKYNLDMKLVSVVFTLDGSKVIINYVCEDRVDFRELVKDLASQLKLRIELRQIGIRDQAKIIGGIGFCGKECCCKKYLNDFDKVSIKMAKAQGLSLNPTKISGICGRLMCCLSYENDFYSEISAKMPKLNSRVKTKDGVGVVVYNNLLKQKVTVKLDLGNEIKVSEYELSDIEIQPKVQTEQPKKTDTANKSAEDKKSVEQKTKEKDSVDSSQDIVKNSQNNSNNKKQKYNNFKNKNKNKDKK